MSLPMILFEDESHRLAGSDRIFCMTNQFAIPVFGDAADFLKSFSVFIDFCKKVRGFFPNRQFMGGHQCPESIRIVTKFHDGLPDIGSLNSRRQIHPMHPGFLNTEHFCPNRKKAHDHRLSRCDADEPELFH